MTTKQALKEYIMWGSIDGKEPSDELLEAMDKELKLQRGNK